MRKITWSADKNRQLKSATERNICFEDIVAAIDSGGLLADVAHPNQEKYPGQRLLAVRVNDYVYSVPCVPTEEGLFFKTAFLSRRLKRIYMTGDENG